jgi:hypothetical protein
LGAFPVELITGTAHSPETPMNYQVIKNDIIDSVING